MKSWLIATLMENQEEIDYIKKYFDPFFQENGFSLTLSTINEITFENHCSKIIFSYDIKYQSTFEEAFFGKKDGSAKYPISHLIEFLNKDIQFEKLLQSYTGTAGNLKMTDIRAYSLIIPKYLSQVIRECDFSWEEELKKYMAKHSKW